MKLLIILLQVLLASFVASQSTDSGIGSSTYTGNTGGPYSSSTAASASSVMASETSTDSTDLGHQSTTGLQPSSDTTGIPLGHQTVTSSALQSVNPASSTAGDGHQSASTNVGTSTGASSTPTGSSEGKRAFVGDGVAVMCAAGGVVAAVMLLL